MSGGLLVFVIGEILPEGEHHALRFSQVTGGPGALPAHCALNAPLLEFLTLCSPQVFHLAPMNNSFIVTNDMFTLNYG